MYMVPSSSTKYLQVPYLNKFVQARAIKMVHLRWDSPGGVSNGGEQMKNVTDFSAHEYASFANHENSPKSNLPNSVDQQGV